MTPADFESFSEVVVGFAELKGKQLSAAAIKLYWAAMQSWELQEFRQAATQLLRTSEFMPTPRDFEELRRAGRLTAGEAWASVRRACRNGQTSCDDPLIDRVVGILGGYRELGHTNIDQMPFLERRFAAHYAELQDAGDVREALPQIANTTRRLAAPQHVTAALPLRKPA